jgi:hypothetical protein
VIQRRSPLPTAQRPKVPLAGLGGGQVTNEPKAAAGQERRNLARSQAEPPRLAPALDAFDPAASFREPGKVARQHGPVDIGKHQQAAGGRGGKVVHGAKRLVDGGGVR